MPTDPKKTTKIIRRFDELPDDVAEILKRFDQLPDSANVSARVAAAHDGVSERNVRRHYPKVPLSPGRSGVNVGWLRSRGKPATA